MLKYAIAFLLISVVKLSFGQTAFKQNDIYLEALGNGLFGSVNYERQLSKAPALGVRLGVGFYTENAFYLTVPVGINYLFSLKNDKSFIDAGLGVTFTKEADKPLFTTQKKYNSFAFTNFVPSISYRRHTANNVMWRISLTPVINKFTFVPWLGFSIGKRF